jgi:hypothetical protein
MQKMQDNMKVMQALMAQIHATKDPAERQRLMTQHMAAMQSQMAMMHGMRGQMGSMMGGGGPGGPGPGPNAQGGPQGRMDMMEMMMGQMLEHQAAMQGSMMGGK